MCVLHKLSARQGALMEPNLILKTSTALFAISALGGALMAIIRFSGKPHPPSWLAMLHGFLAAAGLTLLVFAAVTASLPSLATLALILFLVAAAGGVLLNLRFHLNGIPLPKWLVLVHGGIAVVGFICLLMATWA
jgi:peptidoglycan/LPS O-acetylase OafA/YrhL